MGSNYDMSLVMKGSGDVYPFNDAGKNQVENVKQSDTYKIQQKLKHKQPVTQEEKDKIYKELRGNSYSRTKVPLHGVFVDFKPYLHKYYVKYDYGTVNEVYALNKTSVRNEERGVSRIDEVSPSRRERKYAMAGV